MRNPSLVLFKASTPFIALVVAIGLLAGTSAFASDPVYKWKDASGQSHYSQQPPDGVKYETITPAGAPASSVAAVSPAKGGSAPATAATTATAMPTSSGSGPASSGEQNAAAPGSH